MGNAASGQIEHTGPGHPPQRVPSSSPPPSRVPVHRSLRTKKKSLELPDLASLTLTAQDPRAKASSPIPIPAGAQPIGAGGHTRTVALPSTSELYRAPRASRHAPTPPPPAPPAVAQPQPPQPQDPNGRHVEDDEPFEEETVRSTLPIGLLPDHRPARQVTVPTTIEWHGGGRVVLLARAGDQNWKGRRPMDRVDDVNFRTTVNLFPGTHHIKFVVDDVWRVADSLPAAVDDDGSLANYIDVAPPAPASTPSQPTSPLPTTANHGPLPTIQAPPPGPQPQQFHGGGGSFWSSGGSETGFAASSGTWTDLIPPALVAAAHEEEVFLADHSSAGTGATAPRIPPAPQLPRHLDKLILNARPPQPRGEREGRSSKKDKERDREKEKERDKGDRAERGSRTRGAAPVPVPELDAPDGDESRAPGMKTRLRDGGAGPTPALADDASVLPVPSHVVLHHLSTSAIRNGVLAVGNTTRYRKKGQFITTVYYKPT